MITLISASDNKITAAFDKRFARAAWFCLYNDKAKTVEFVRNTLASTPGHIGITVANSLIQQHVQRTISGDYGLKVKNHLDKHNIQMVILPDKPFTIEEIINFLKQ